jgi:hypothetical protein
MRNGNTQLTIVPSHKNRDLLVNILLICNHSNFSGIWPLELQHAGSYHLF